MVGPTPLYPSGNTQLIGSENPLDYKKYPGRVPLESSDTLMLDPEQAAYQGFIESRLMNAQELRDRRWPEFSNKTYLQQYEENEKISMTYLEPKRNEDDVVVASGTVESKLNSILSNIEALNLTPEVLAFNKNDVPLHMLGIAITDILDRCAENDGGTDGGDAEKRTLRQKELLKQGTVFVQDRWVCKKQPKKKLTKKFDGSFDFDSWTTKLEKVFEGPERTLLYGPNVYLGDPTQFAIEDQPYLFTVEQMNYDVAKGIYGQFDNWDKVKKGMPPSTATMATAAVGGRTIFDGKFRLTTLKNDQVEIIKYQDETRDEFQIMINGVMQLPIGYPLSAVASGGRYNIAKQILYPLNAQFAYGKSFVSSGDIYELSKILDEFLRLFTLKTRKSVTPAYINTSGKVISKRVLSPGNISMGIPVGALQPINSNETQGVLSGEFQFYKELQDRIEQSTVSPIFQGQFGKANTTATEVLQVQEQAQKALGLIVAACTMLEIKLTYLRLPIVLDNWFAPIGEQQSGDGAQKTYRNVSKDTVIDDAGAGVRRVIPIDGQLPDKEVIRHLELEDEKATGKPSERVYLSPMKLQAERLVWRAVVIPKPKESTAFQQVQFMQTINAIAGMVNLGSRPNISGIEDEFSKVYGKDKGKFFTAPTDMTAMVSPGGASSADPRASAAQPQGNSPGMANLPGAPSSSPGMANIGG